MITNIWASGSRSLSRSRPKWTSIFWRCLYNGRWCIRNRRRATLQKFMKMWWADACSQEGAKDVCIVGLRLSWRSLLTGIPLSFWKWIQNGRTSVNSNLKTRLASFPPFLEDHKFQTWWMRLNPVSAFLGNSQKRHQIILLLIEEVVVTVFSWLILKWSR